MEFIRCRKAPNVSSSTSPSEHPEDKSSKEEPSGNVSQESSKAAGLFQKPQDVEMEEKEEEELLVTPAAMTGGILSK